jgi:membrane-bound serine protease (ClpP class)
MKRPASWCRSSRRMRAGLLCPAAAFVIALGAQAAAAQPSDPNVLVATVDGPITPVAANYLSDAVSQAEGDGSRALVVALDTPGGLDTSMRKIVQEFTAADVPVIVFVSPRGARAASAGAIITFSAHVAAMAPGTAIGAATPVDLEGGEVERKVINDAAAFAESIARLRGRNVDFARDSVLQGKSIPADEAAEIKAVDLIARSLPELLDSVDGRRVQVGPEDRTVTLETRGVTAVPFEAGLFRRIQSLLADPNLAFLLLSLGTLGIVYELMSPGVGAGGAVGVISIVLALFGLSVLPVSVVGLLLLGLAAALFIAELFAPGVGIAAAAGTVALLLAGIFLFRDVPGIRVSLAVILPVVAVVGVAVVAAGRLVVRSHRDHVPITGEDQYVGKIVTTTRVNGNRGQALVDGAWWNVKSSGSKLNDGDRVRVVGYEGLDLLVEPLATLSGSENVDQG